MSLFQGCLLREVLLSNNLRLYSSNTKVIFGTPLPTAMAKLREELQSSYQQEITKLEEERNILQRSLSTKRAKLAAREKEKDDLQKKVWPCTSQAILFMPLQ